MNGGRCLITGCGLAFSDDPDTSHWGDLHEFEGMLIFNAVISKPFDTAVLHELNPDDKVVIIYSNTPLVEARGIFIFPRAAATLNPAAQAYLDK